MIENLTGFVPIDPDEIAAVMRAPGILRDVRPRVSAPPSGTRTPAARWLAALPVGNGRLGATVFGRVYKETIILNEETRLDTLAGRSQQSPPR